MCCPLCSLWYLWLICDFVVVWVLPAFPIAPFGFLLRSFVQDRSFAFFSKTLKWETSISRSSFKKFLVIANGLYDLLALCFNRTYWWTEMTVMGMHNWIKFGLQGKSFKCFSNDYVFVKFVWFLFLNFWYVFILAGFVQLFFWSRAITLCCTFVSFEF